MIEILAVLIVAGLFLWLLGQFPLDPTIKRIAHAVVIVLVVLWLVRLLLALA